MDPESAVGAFDRALASSRPAVFVADIDWPTFGRSSSAGLRTLFEDIPEARQPEPTSRSADQPTEHGSLRELSFRQSSAEQAETLMTLVRTHSATVLGRDRSDAVTSERPFRDLGFDSLAAIELRNQLTADTELELPTTLVFDHPTPAKLATFLRTELLGTRRRLTAAVPHPGRADEPIAIVGMACRFPGGVSTPEHLWELVPPSTMPSAPSPPTGLGPRALYDPDPDHPGTTYARHGGFLYNAADFDADFFGITPRKPSPWTRSNGCSSKPHGRPLERAGITPHP